VRNYYAVAFRALHLESSSLYFSVEIFSGRTEAIVARRGMKSFKAKFPAKKGWGMWNVITSQIPPEDIARAIREAKWFDQAGAQRLYASAVCAYHEQRKISSLVTGHLFARNRACAGYKMDEYASKNYPVSEGWSLTKIDLEEFADLPVSRYEPEISWSGDIKTRDC
jgi:hypothetical protein